ncbi:MAG: glycoside hydrolase family 92 protein [Kiritimatiellae bacterium]|nr:glycoside hydrolase family 92 protein [Kiritimatiellia bacterium]
MDRRRARRDIAKRFYSTKKDGICGNDDCGQMDAWYIFAALGFYPVDPCGGRYVIGAPLFPRTELSLPGGRKFTVLANSPSGSRCRVKSAFLNGKPVKDRTVPHDAVVRGGELVFELRGR